MSTPADPIQWLQHDTATKDPVSPTDGTTPAGQGAQGTHSDPVEWLKGQSDYKAQQQQLQEQQKKQQQSDSSNAPEKGFSGFIKGLGKGSLEETKGLNPLPGLSQAVQHPIQTLSNIGPQQDALRQKAVQAFKNGDYAGAARHAVGWLLPVIGPHIDMMGDLAQSGHLGQALGHAGVFGVTTAGPLKALPEFNPASPRVNAATALGHDPTAGETAAQVAETSTPENAIANYTRARQIQQAAAAYRKASTSMKQTMQQQAIFQIAKESGGDIGKFGQLWDEWKQGLPLEDHQVWEGAKQGILQGILSPEAQAGISVLKTAAKPSLMSAVNTVAKLMATRAGRKALAGMRALTLGSPEAGAAWNSARATLAAGKELGRAATAKPGDDNTPYARGGPVMDRLRQGTLRSLRG
jgi:hypothetical protein